MKESILKNIVLSIEGKDVSMVLAGDNTKEGGKEAYRAVKVIEKLFIKNNDYDTLTCTVLNRKDSHHILWCVKLELHGDLENYVLDMVGGEFLSGLSA